MALSLQKHVALERGSRCVRCVAPRAWCHAVVLATFWTGSICFAAEVKHECPPEKGLCTLVSVSQDDLSAPDIWSMGADILGVYEHRWYVRVSDAMLADLADRSIPFTLIQEDIYEGYEAHRQLQAVRRSETFTDYHDFDDVAAAMNRIATAYPDIAAMTSIGTSIEGRPIHALRISDNAQTVEPDEPGMIVVGCHHAREWISVEVPLYLADVLTDQYLQRGDVTRLVRYSEIWIIPVLNPDGFVYSWTDDRWWRKNRRNNGDGTSGVDPNRNYSIGFGDDEGSSRYTLFETYRGPYAFSEPETQAMRDLMKGTFGRTFDASLSYHNFNQLVMYPNGYTADPVYNAAYYAELAGSMVELINASHSDDRYDYLGGQSSHLLYFSSGDYSDWAHHEAGAVSIIIELRPAGPPFFELPPAEILPTCRENLPAFLYMAEQTLIPDLKFMDGDFDGIVDSEDHCPNSPSSAPIDEIGCAAIEADLDGDGVINTADVCPDSLPAQRVGSDGCRIETLFSVYISANLSSVEVTVIPSDIDGEADGNTGDFGFAREYSDETMLLLTAADTADGHPFVRWVINGEAQRTGEYTALITTDIDVTAEAVYAIPERAEVVGLSRIPDCRADGLAYLQTYSVHIHLSDGSERTVEMKDVIWSLSDTSVASMTREGELIAFDVSAEEGEVSVILTAEVKSDDRSLISEPFVVTIFDIDTVPPRCLSIVLEGADHVDSNSTCRLQSRLLLEGDVVARSEPESVEWSVSLPDESTVETAPVSIAPDGRLTSGWVEVDTDVIVMAAYINDDESACLAQKPLTIIAGAPSDAASADLSTSPRTLPSPCGTTGMIGLVGLLLGLLAFRLTRR